MIEMKLTVDKKKIELEICTHFWNRFLGFMFQKKKIEKGKCFPRCNAIHTFFMTQNIDLILCDRKNIVRKTYSNFSKNRILLPQKRIYYIYELPLETAKYFAIGDQIHLEE